MSNIKVYFSYMLLLLYSLLIVNIGPSRNSCNILYTQREMMFLNLVSSSYLNSNNHRVKQSSAYANIRCIHQLLLKTYCIIITRFTAPCLTLVTNVIH